MHTFTSSGSFVVIEEDSLTIKFSVVLPKVELKPHRCN